jgi:hypothetical protein
MFSLFEQINQACGIFMAPFGVGFFWFDLILWPIVMGVVALWVYKHISNQPGIDRAKNLIKAHLLEIRIFRDDPLAVLGATGRIFIQNAKYLGYNLVPMVVLILPMLLVLIQLERMYAFGPIEENTTALFEVTLDPDVPKVKTTDVALKLPDGVRLDAPPVRTADGRIFWRLTVESAGDHPLTVDVGGTPYTKILNVGGEARPVSILKAKGWLSLLYPNEGMLPANSPIQQMAFPAPEQELSWLPGGELGIVLWFLGLSLAAGYTLKGFFGVSL